MRICADKTQMNQTTRRQIPENRGSNNVRNLCFGVDINLWQVLNFYYGSLRKKKYQYGNRAKYFMS